MLIFPKIFDFMSLNHIIINVMII